jgi:signal transduction histidine kinase
MDASFVEYFTAQSVTSMLSVHVPYQDDTFAVILLLLCKSSEGRVWREDEMLLLQEASAQGTLSVPLFLSMHRVTHTLADALRDSAAVEIGLSHARTFEEERKSKELAWRNAALEQEKTLAETASQAKSEFLAVMSHEIRYTILTRYPFTSRLRSLSYSCVTQEHR